MVSVFFLVSIVILLIIMSNLGMEQRPRNSTGMLRVSGYCLAIASIFRN
jgi:hypothetical protein